MPEHFLFFRLCDFVGVIHTGDFLRHCQQSRLPVLR